MSDSASFDLEGALRPPLRSLRGYEPIDPPEQVAARYGVAPEAIVKLDGNENPYGPSPRALEALAGGYAAHRYPDPEQRRLRGALGARHGVPPECIVAGAGADEIIDLVFRIFVEAGDRVVIASPTFGMYPFGAEIAGAELVDVPRRDDWSVDLDALAAACEGAKAVFLPSPNNPTGGLLPPGAAERLRTSGAIVVIDEAYVEFASGREGGHSGSPSLADRAAEDGERGEAPLIVLRTFSKWAGLAGLRVGYGVMPAPVASLLMQCKQPYGVSTAGEAAALASLEDAALLDERACEIAGERDRLAAELRAGGWLEPVPSQANFLLCRLTSGSGAALREALARRGVFVRFFGHERLRDHVRISIGTPEDSERLLAALSEARAEVEGRAA
ncbi:MAG: histidinol-phosphate transaminase [Chloroflexi bacterium]|nr:histidinol-phosphate transaminase [Chloroflexota bacterium]